MKNTSPILLAFALLAMMTQCKKANEQITPDNSENTVAITLSVGGNSNSKVDVDPMLGTVDFESGDKIYVGSGGKYVGMLTHNGDHHFVGNITNPTEGQPLQFYFLGNVTPEETLGAGTTEECSVIISDQTQHLPVISCAPSNEEYSPATTTYTAHLKNKCALVKFDVTSLSNTTLFMTGFYNKVTVDFTNNTLTNSKDGEGVIMLSGGSGEKWAILLPQEALEEGEEGSAYSAYYIGARPAIPEILVNGYSSEGIAVAVNTPSKPGAVGGLFSVSATKQVLFSQGNLQYTKSTQKWSFMEHQYDVLGTNGQDVGNDYANVDVVSYFGWGTSGCNLRGTNTSYYYQPYNTNQQNGTYYGPNGFYNLTGNYANGDWGIYNAISNGGNTAGVWRTLSQAEWAYVFTERDDASSKWGRGRVDNIFGVIILPDTWELPSGLSFTAGNDNWTNAYTEEQWAEMQAAGAVFLPAAGWRRGTEVSRLNEQVLYWSSSCNNDYTEAHNLLVEDDGILIDDASMRHRGMSVRLVTDAE